MADDRFAAPRPASISATRAATASPRPAAACFNAVQNASSSDTLVWWPATNSECFVVEVCDEGFAWSEDFV